MRSLALVAILLAATEVLAARIPEQRAAAAGAIGHGDDHLLVEEPASPVDAVTGHTALQFLYRHLPPIDRGVLSDDFLNNNVALAVRARSATSWARNVPWDLFLNNVLPHANLDEPRDGWRSLMNARLRPLVSRCSSAAEAALLLNKQIWKIWNITFKPGQTPDIMSPSQVIAAGYASCTGLSIFLVNACRSVGIPARVVGTPAWLAPIGGRGRVERSDLRGAWKSGRQLVTGGQRVAVISAGVEDRQPGIVLHEEEEPNNHNWVEVWDGTSWSFVGAAEYDPKGFNRTWFFPQPAQSQVPGSRLHAIYAVSYKPSRSRTTYPLAWNANCSWVNAEDVTQSYRDAAQPAVH